MQPTSTSTNDVPARSQSALESSQGKTTIADTVVSKIAGIAAKEVNGVYSLGGGASRIRTLAKPFLPAMLGSLVREQLGLPPAD